MEWSEITKNTPLEEVKQLHQPIWNYVIENGEKSENPYISIGLRMTVDVKNADALSLGEIADHAIIEKVNILNSSVVLIQPKNPN